MSREPARFSFIRKTECAFATTTPTNKEKISAAELLGNLRVLRIEHKGAEYFLRITKNDKLILTK